MNKIYRNLISAFVFVILLLYAVISISMFRSNIRAEKKYISDIAEQVINNIDVSRDAYAAKVDTMEAVWEERIRNADEIIASKPRMRNQASLAQLSVLLGANDIYLFSEDGTILIGTDETKIGQGLADESEKMQALISGEIPSGYYFHIEESGFWENPSYCRIAMRSQGDAYAALCIDMDTNQMGLKCEKAIIENTLQEAATDYDTSIAAVGTESGRILGMTVNNEQNMQIEGIGSSEEMIAFMKRAYRDGVSMAKISGESCIMYVSQMPGAFIVSYSSFTDIVEASMVQWGKVLVAFGVALFVMIVCIRHSFRKYILNHIEETESKLEEILDGNYKVTLKEGNNEDINKLLRVIEKLKNGYIHKSERSDKLVNVLGENVAVFEYAPDADFYYFSDKLSAMLGMEDEQWQAALEDKNSLIDLLKRLDGSKDDGDIVSYNGKHLEIQTFPIEQELVGVIRDRTEELDNWKKLESELRLSKEKMEQDGLTHVMNRSGFESCVKQYLRESGEGGVLIAFDLDYFKQLNDALGHPEGDKALCIFANGLRTMFRSGDVVGRLGGDEFSVFMTGPNAYRAAERKVARILEELNVSFGIYHDKYGLSASAGIAYVQANDDYDEIYKKADKALYKAKKAGKNTYALWQEDGQGNP